jgi:hypothetical protein
MAISAMLIDPDIYVVGIKAAHACRNKEFFSIILQNALNSGFSILKSIRVSSSLKYRGS